MTLVPALLALTLVSRQAPTNPQAPVTPPTVLAGQSVNLRFPTADDGAPAEEVRLWSGWGNLKGDFPRPFRTENDWSAVRNASLAANPVVWRIKVVVLTEAETMHRDARGLLRSQLFFLGDPNVTRALESVLRFGQLVALRTGGKVKVLPDVSIESERMYEDATAGGDYGDAFLQKYLGPRVNGGLYDAEDHVYRGPYGSVFVITPFPIRAETTVNGMPVTEIPFFQTGGASLDGTVDDAMLAAWTRHLAIRMAEQGFHHPWPTGDDEWTAAASLEEPATDVLLTRLAAPATASNEPTPADARYVPSYKAPNYTLAVANDANRGSVLSVKEDSVPRDGGVALPIPSGGIDLAKTPTLAFFVRSTAKDRIALRVDGAEKSAWISLGRDAVPVPRRTEIAETELPFNPDGSWQHVVVDLRKALQGVGESRLTGLVLGPTPYARAATRRQTGPLEYQFDGFSLGNDPATDPLPAPAPNADSTDSEERALAAIQPDASVATLTKLVKDADADVALNAVAALGKLSDPKTEPILIEGTGNINPRVVEVALRGLAARKTETALAAIRSTLKYGITDWGRGVAAGLLADTGDAKTADDIMILLANRSWVTREAALEALGKLPGAPVGIIRLAFLPQDDPEIKVETVRLTDPSRDYEMSKLLWAAINEPSDAVRAESDIKLIQATNANDRTEGYKGVRDDSREVRLRLVDWMREHPNEANRPALLLAVTDRSASVRAAALRALAAQPGAVSNDEIANVLTDKQPEVQLALVQLSKAKGVKLSDATVEGMKSSPDPRVPEAAKSLG